MIAVVDYGMGNLRSVQNALELLDATVVIARQPAELERADGIILPGVGAFGDGMRNLKGIGFVEALTRQVRERGKPFLGICLGMELLAETSLELGEHRGLGWLGGRVERLLPTSAGLRVPHIGWNDVRFTQTLGLYNGLGETRSFYFVHSFVFRPADPAVVTGVCDYGGEFAASVESGNISGTQYHPEKSHEAGIGVLRNFIARVEAGTSLRSV